MPKGKNDPTKKYHIGNPESEEKKEVRSLDLSVSIAFQNLMNGIDAAREFLSPGEAENVKYILYELVSHRDSSICYQPQYGKLSAADVLSKVIDLDELHLAFDGKENSLSKSPLTLDDAIGAARDLIKKVLSILTVRESLPLAALVSNNLVGIRNVSAEELKSMIDDGLEVPEGVQGAIGEGSTVLCADIKSDDEEEDDENGDYISYFTCTAEGEA